MSTGTSGPVAGWYADPEGAPRLRYWDGTAWTPHFAPLPAPTPPAQQVPPAPPVPPVPAPPQPAAPPPVPTPAPTPEPSSPPPASQPEPVQPAPPPTPEPEPASEPEPPLATPAPAAAPPLPPAPAAPPSQPAAAEDATVIGGLQPATPPAVPPPVPPAGPVPSIPPAGPAPGVQAAAPVPIGLPPAAAYQPAKRKSRTGLIIGIILGALALLAIAVVAVVLILLPKFRVLDTASLETQIAGTLSAGLGQTYTVDCPESQRVEKGASFTCTATGADGQQLSISVVQDDDQGNVTWNVVD